MRGYFRTRIIGMAPPQRTFVKFGRFVVKINTEHLWYQSRDVSFDQCPHSGTVVTTSKNPVYLPPKSGWLILVISYDFERLLILYFWHFMIKL